MLDNHRLFRSNTSLKINKIVSALLIIIVSFCLVSPVNAMTQTIKLKSLSGYLVETTFSYDNNQAINMFSEQGFGKTKVIDSMTVSFYKPSGELISSYENIIDGIVQGKYFEFNFDPLTQKLLGNIDLGGEITGEIYLKGVADQELSLVEIEASGSEKIIDQLVQ